jgi:hypothetical protein
VLQRPLLPSPSAIRARSVKKINKPTMGAIRENFAIRHVMIENTRTLIMEKAFADRSVINALNSPKR